jgi:IS30 family transposase
MNKIALRMEAVHLYLDGESKASIGRQLGKSRDWVSKWISRYDPDDPEGSLQDRSSAPKKPYRKWSDEVIQKAIQSRKLRMEACEPGYKYRLVGAEAIHYELKALGIIPTPPPRTIHHWLKQADLVEKKEPRLDDKKSSKPYPQPIQKKVNDLHQLDIKGPFYLSGSPQKYYLIALRDCVSKRIALQVSKNHQSQTVTDFLVKAWQRIGIPKILQMDNGLEFRGSNRYPRSFGKVVRLCLDLQVEPRFIPQREPWRNGVIENCNGLVSRLLLKRHNIADFSSLQKAVKELETAINTSHRLAALGGKSPDEFVASHEVRILDPDYDRHLRDLQLVKGKISFVRLVRKSGRITLCAKDKFVIDTDLQWQYVLAQVVVRSQKLKIYHQMKLVKTLDFDM